MPRAICEDCESLVEAELTHNGICAVGHYVHCGWGHELSPDDLISDDVAEIISKLEAKLAQAVGALEECMEEIDAYIRQEYPHDHPVQERYRQRDYAANPARLALAEIKGESHE